MLISIFKISMLLNFWQYFPHAGRKCYAQLERYVKAFRILRRSNGKVQDCGPRGVNFISLVLNLHSSL